MERHVGTWSREGENQKAQIGELIIDGHIIEFYGRFSTEVFCSTYVGSDGHYRYKVFLHGGAISSNRRSLDNVSAHRVSYVLVQNFDFSHGTDISGIREVSFEIPELLQWGGMRTVDYAYTVEGTIGAVEVNIPDILINEENPRVELYLESRTFDSTIMEQDNTAITIKNIPRIRIKYDASQDIDRVVSDIECVSEFFGLLIGHLSGVKDIRLITEGQEGPCGLYINKDFSYNLRTVDSVFEKPRTYYYVVKEQLNSYYNSWNSFYQDDTYSLLRRIYFAANRSKDIFAEEIFIEYMRFLDGYHTRICGDEEKKKKISVDLGAATKEIKALLFNDEGKALFEKSMKQADPEWKCNSKHIQEIAGWIAAGYLGKTQLSYRIQELDKMFLGIIGANAVDVEKNTRNRAKYENISADELNRRYFRDLGDTRNYYSHYKLDETGVLEIQQIIQSISILKATIVTILLKHMGMDLELIRKVMAFDTELWEATMFLRADGEMPFEHPSQIERASEECVCEKQPSEKPARIQKAWKQFKMVIFGTKEKAK